jgi:hypothetical protein
MGLLSALAFPVLGPIKGVMWVAQKVGEQAENTIYNPETVHGQLMELELKFDLGEISEADFNEAEETLLARLRFIRERNKTEEE